MLVSEAILTSYNSRLVHLKKNDTLFLKGEQCRFFYQVQHGCVKMVSINDDGKEYTQGFFKDGESFAEPALICGFNYPATTIAVEDSSIWQCPKQDFFEILKHHFEIHFNLTHTLSTRLRYKAMMLEEISMEDAKHRLLSIIDFYKPNKNGVHVVEFSRQDLANMTGLRVETVIRTIKKLEESGDVRISGGKIYRQ